MAQRQAPLPGDHANWFSTEQPSLIFPFSDLARDAATFTVRGVPVKVGRLTKLLTSKKLAGRLKDRQFLQRYRSLLEGES